MKKLNIKLLYQYILLKSVEQENNTTSSGIVLSGDNNMAYGEIVEVGTGRMLENGDMAPMVDIKIGDKIMYKKGPEEIIHIDGEKYILVMDVNIVMVLNK